MKDRIIAAVVTAIVHNKRMSIAGLVAFLGIAAAKLGLQVSPDVLVWVAGLIIVALGAAGGDSHVRAPRRPAL